MPPEAEGAGGKPPESAGKPPANADPDKGGKPPKDDDVLPSIEGK